MPGHDSVWVVCSYNASSSFSFFLHYRAVFSTYVTVRFSQTSSLAKTIDREYWVKKEVERKKYRPKDVVAEIRNAGFTKFKIQPEHLDMWKAEDAKNPAKGYGVDVAGTWYWYQTWVDRCLELCTASEVKYK